MGVVKKRTGHGHFPNPTTNQPQQGVVAEYLKDVPSDKYLCFEAAIASSVPLGSVRLFTLLSPSKKGDCEKSEGNEWGGEPFDEMGCDPHQTHRPLQHIQGLSSSASLEVGFATFVEQILGALLPFPPPPLRQWTRPCDTMLCPLPTHQPVETNTQAPPRAPWPRLCAARPLSTSLRTCPAESWTSSCRRWGGRGRSCCWTAGEREGEGCGVDGWREGGRDETPSRRN